MALEAQLLPEKLFFGTDAVNRHQRPARFTNGFYFPLISLLTRELYIHWPAFAILRFIYGLALSIDFSVRFPFPLFLFFNRSLVRIMLSSLEKIYQRETTHCDCDVADVGRGICVAKCIRVRK